jgi:uncharacterized protein
LPMKERLDSVDQVRQWTDAIPLQYEYTAGVAGEKFLRGLKEGRILAGRCTHCRETQLPARTYCVNCYRPIEGYPEVRPVGKVSAITETTYGQKGERLAEPVTYAFVSFSGVEGGIVHKIIGKTKIGSSVVPRFRPEAERRGSILDIEGFEPAP